MPRVVPSQVVDFIKTCFQRDVASLSALMLGREQAGPLAGLVELVEKIPEELLPADAAAYAALITGVCHIRETLAFWASGRDASSRLMSPVSPYQMNAVAIIFVKLSQCPDRAAATATAELNFIADTDLREELRRDLSEVNRALADGEWKGATVLAGSIIEALLLWKLGQIAPAELARVSQIAPKLPSAPLDQWHLADYIAAAQRLRILTDRTVAQCTLARDFRNLIHPGRAQRLGEKCDRGTALSAVAGVTHVIRELS